MSARLGTLALLALVIGNSLGCCCDLHMPWPCGRTYCGAECGPKWCHEWFSHKPPCCEPCSYCGQDFTGSCNPYVDGGLACPTHPNAGGGGYGDYTDNMAPMQREELLTPTPMTSGEYYDEFGQQAYNDAPQGPPRRGAAPPREMNAPARGMRMVDEGHGRATSASYRR